ncbi:MAG: DUF1963 domain-containing protein [Thioalkalivibrio sp.]|nr:DUF1963 domain-containing protein [Thioalkalivibrio sp.]
MAVGGFRPPESPLASWVGRVNVALPGEAWPTTEGQPMHALCQINLTEMPFRPAGLEDVELVTVFIGPSELPLDTPNGVGWCLRAYPDIQALVPLKPVSSGAAIRAFPMRPEVVEEDFPCWEDVPIELPDSVEDQYDDLFANSEGIKLGGWPSLVQSEIYWAPLSEHSAEPHYVFQIDSVEKANWQWGDSGIGYFGRGSTPGASSEWFLSWQCY